MKFLSLIVAGFALASPLLQTETTVEGDARDPDVVIKKSIDKPGRTESIRDRRPGSPGEQPRVPVDDVPVPFFCRPEAPFPQDECIPLSEPGEAADPAEADAPGVTPGDVVEAVRRIGLPRLTVAVQPAGSTLVNLDTILYTTAAPFERTVPMLGSTVELQATPATYTWHHGDGTTQTTSRPGRPYPALDVTHQYRDAGSIAARVDVAYRVTFRIDGGAWQDLGTTITAEGPATALRVREARPVLTD